MEDPECGLGLTLKSQSMHNCQCNPRLVPIDCKSSFSLQLCEWRADAGR